MPPAAILRMETKAAGGYLIKDTMNTYFQPADVCCIIGITYRQLQYWDMTGFI